MRRVGYHAIVELYGCSFEYLDDILLIKKTFKEAIKKSSLKEIHFEIKRFNPHGVTAFSLLTTSHISIHTWPEINYAALDIFTCSNKKSLNLVIKTFINMLKPKNYKKIIIERG